MTPEKKTIIESAVNAAIAFGTGICSNVAKELTDAGYHYSLEVEDYAIKYWCSLQKEVEI